MSSVKIPYSQMEDIRRYNQNIGNSGDKMERMLYQAAKRYSVKISQEKADTALEQCKENIYALARRKKQKRRDKFMGAFMGTISAITVILLFSLRWRCSDKNCEKH